MRVYHHNNALFMSLCLVLAGCLATTPIAQTQSKRPEITTTASSDAIKKETIRQMTNDGMLLVSSSEGLLLFEGEADSATQFWSSNYTTGARPKVRHRFNIVDMTDTRRVIMSMYLEKPATQTSKVNSENEIITDAANQRMQTFLASVKLALETTKKK